MFTNNMAKNFWQKIKKGNFLVLLAIMLVACEIGFRSMDGFKSEAIIELYMLFNCLAAMVAAWDYAKNGQAGFKAWSLKRIKIAAIFEAVLILFCLLRLWDISYLPINLVLMLIALTIVIIPFLMILLCISYSEYIWKKLIEIDPLVLVTVAVAAYQVIFWGMMHYAHEYHSSHGYNEVVSLRGLLMTAVLFVVLSYAAAIVAACDYTINGQGGFKAWSLKRIRITAGFESFLVFFCLYMRPIMMNHQDDIIIMWSLVPLAFLMIVGVVIVPFLLILWCKRAVNHWKRSETSVLQHQPT